jgi:hypothetical protein
MENRYWIRFSLLWAVITATTTQAEIVVVVNPSCAATAMTQDEVANVYLGKDPSYLPIDLPQSSQQRNEFYQKVVGKDLAQIKALWARLVFTGKMQPPKQASSAADALKYVASNVNGIAYVDKSAVDASVKAVLTLD